MNTSKKSERSDIEIDCLLEAIFQHYGYDFRHYARASLIRRIKNCVMLSGLEHISELIPKVLHDRGFFDEYLNHMSVTVTELFRDPEVFKSIRETIIPKIRSYSRINIWHAGCATGEEVYSMAILLEEEGLLKYSHIYATDFNNKSLEIAKAGIYSEDNIALFTENYLKAGGKKSLSDYYHNNYQRIKFNKSLQDKITFAHHNLMFDQVFADVHLVLCRNVLIYFDRKLQNQVLSLLSESLVPRGFLVLGNKETLHYSSIEDDFDVVDEKLRSYRKSNTVVGMSHGL